MNKDTKPIYILGGLVLVVALLLVGMSLVFSQLNTGSGSGCTTALPNPYPTTNQTIVDNISQGEMPLFWVQLD